MHVHTHPGTQACTNIPAVYVCNILFVNALCLELCSEISLCALNFSFKSTRMMVDHLALTLLF